MLFQLPESKVIKIVKVAGVEIPLYGYLTVDESIAVDTSLIKLGDTQVVTQIQIHRIAAWLSVRLKTAESELIANLTQATAKPLIDALWTIYTGEAFTDSQELEVEEVGNESDTVPLSS